MRLALHRPRGDAGSATIQMVFAMPVIGLIIFSTFAFVLYFHAEQIAHLAASQGLEAARVQGGTEVAGQTATERYLAEFDKSTLHDGRVQVQRGAREVRVEVSGYAEQIVPFLNLPVHVTITAPTETIGDRT
ncbi:TadE family protein [Catenulispora pinisilvae]|uniref:TadE family protein n=1 Tax=Catenulispora pinisilvae TaxID=2705253 RepID=UPI001E61C1B9|nr:TadE family protein [Catenulispora pinisilvae]